MFKYGMLAAVSALVCASAAQAQDGRFAIGPQVGTTGVGIEAQFKVSDRITLRGGFDSLSFDEEVEGDGILYDGELDFSTGGIFADLHPTGGAFFLSAGVYFGDRRVNVSGTPAPGTTVEIGDDTFTAAQVGTLNGTLDFGSTAPFMGLGWNNTFTRSRRWGFKFLVGAAFGSDPDATLTRVGGSALSPADQARLDAELRAEEIEIEKEADRFKVFPVVQLGLAYRF
jgi:opacity protein-like surface antigen